MTEEIKRISFDRPQTVENPDTTLQYIYDPEELQTGWERVYTSVSVRDITSAPTKIRWGTGDQKKVKWHTEEPNPAADVVYTTCIELHARQHDLGVVGVYGAQQADKIEVVWHGYDKRIRER